MRQWIDTDDYAARRILTAVLPAIERGNMAHARRALQDAEEMGGPEGLAYIALMNAVRKAATRAKMRALAKMAADAVKAYSASDSCTDAIARQPHVGQGAYVEGRDEITDVPDSSDFRRGRARGVGVRTRPSRARKWKRDLGRRVSLGE